MFPASQYIEGCSPEEAKAASCDGAKLGYVEESPMWYWFWRDEGQIEDS